MAKYGDITRVSSALADYANKIQLNGLTSWDSDVFGVDAAKAIDMIEAQASMADRLNLNSAESYIEDALLHLEWSIDDLWTYDMLLVVYQEIGPDFTGLEFE